LKEHPKTRIWYLSYIKYSNSAPVAILSDDLFNLIKYFISSDLSFNELKNPFLRKLISGKINMPSVKTFRYSILPNVLDMP
jgi:hypothetical protein